MHHPLNSIAFSLAYNDTYRMLPVVSLYNMCLHSIADVLCAAVTGRSEFDTAVDTSEP